MLKKTSTLAHVSGYYRIACHVNMHCSSTTYSYFCLKLIAKKALKKQIIPKFPQKQTKNPPLETSKTENILKMTHVRSKKQKCQKKQKGSCFWEILLPETRVIC